ncbi:hypothetical protein I2486_18590 [Cellulophaga sp. E16_2]|uniref:hypothetical protein n=1 Tax=Cellulophaga sp. E16_2 TaxID=2789297 RepID=UPI001A9174B1|nr:hypothetical protein [Cellulophaga sp. E16_2]MBO0593410.1 hypothetical protein [Cellulophaga sp. E16_2]
MQQQEFLEKNVFIDLKNVNENFEADGIHYFSEADFETVLQKCEYFGIGIYTIEAQLNGASFGVSSHETHNKKATDPKWYKKTFFNFKKGESGMAYTATYKVSNKLLVR